MDERTPRTSWVADAARALATQLAIALVLVGGAGAAWAWWTETPTPLDTVGTVLVVGGAVWMLTGGTLFSKAAEMGSMQWGVHQRHDRVTGERGRAAPAVQLSPLGSALIVGGLLIVLGTLLQL